MKIVGFVFATGLFLAPSIFGQTYTPPKTADGLPDLEGVWQPRAGGAAYSVLPHQGGFFLGGDSKDGIVVGGTLPYQPWAEEEVKQLSAHMELDPTGKCHYEGVPHASYFTFQIFETPQFIAILHENMHARRLIYMDGKPHPQDYKAWMGDSRGHWEGSTLVVDVADNNDKAVFDMAGHFHSDQLHIVERFTPVDKDTINYEATFDDPRVFTRPFQMKFQLKRSTSAYEFFESDCFGGERDQEHIKEGLADLKDHYYK
ncbi:MAG TPA: hypothetical protein VK789_27040 [Bryobacteraceae bacterium]|jgi:hypothetical protein|nr:hypothetical protein [Bryobacteraceae bacterium]